MVNTRILHTVYPSTMNNVAQGRSPGVSQRPAAVDHIHSSMGQEQLLFWKRGIDMNVTTDQLLTKNGKFTSWLFTRARIANANTSLTLAKGSLYTQAAKAGVAFMATTHAFVALTGATLGMDATVAAAALDELTGANGTDLYVALTTAQGGAATADWWIFGIPLIEP